MLPQTHPGLSIERSKTLFIFLFYGVTSVPGPSDGSAQPAVCISRVTLDSWTNCNAFDLKISTWYVAVLRPSTTFSVNFEPLRQQKISPRETQTHLLRRRNTARACKDDSSLSRLASVYSQVSQEERQSDHQFSLQSGAAGGRNRLQRFQSSDSMRRRHLFYPFLAASVHSCAAVARRWLR